ncbi:hypothetical protein HAH_4398 [Haloarcula hispanica ATCC 33960]|uniref:Uncharacterized protein n=1 Tax=Haloarcula hispanica (strain ATCC 33960 / DSM 4426 / JCM 8911 / NBRC 102182 / NCIMB 2187 / VKM B-1755) TaxID=634497 RepID=G0HZ18_HALHT|nr:hypothetical protein HAH_4398 [Haloarcula hispanica ATCC 33960]
MTADELPDTYHEDCYPLTQVSNGMVGSRGEWRATHHSKSSSTTTGSGLGPIDDLNRIQGGNGARTRTHLPVHSW